MDTGGKDGVCVCVRLFLCLSHRLASSPITRSTVAVSVQLTEGACHEPTHRYSTHTHGYLCEATHWHNGLPKHLTVTTKGQTVILHLTWPLKPTNGRRRSRLGTCVLVSKAFKWSYWLITHGLMDQACNFVWWLEKALILGLWRHCLTFIQISKSW